MSRLRFKLVVGAAFFCLSLFLADQVVQRIVPVPRRGYGVWAAYPGSRLEMVSRPDGCRQTHRYNRYGFRGEDFPIQPQARYRIAAVGDSYTEGSGVKVEEAWPAVLNRLLAPDFDLEVLNLGDGGSAPDRYAEIVAKVAIPLKPTDIIVCFIPSDLRFGPKVPPSLEARSSLDDPFRENRAGWQKPLVRLFPGLVYLVERQFGKWPLQTGSIWLPYGEPMTEMAAKRVSQLQRLPLEEARIIVDRRLSELDPEVTKAAREAAFNPGLVRLALSEAWSYRVRTVDMDIPLAELTGKTRDWLDWYRSTAESHGIRPWVLYFPQAALVAEGRWGPLLESEYEVPQVLGNTSVRDLLRSVCAEVGIGFVDSTAALESKAGARLFLRYDTHPTAKAHEIVAGEVARSLSGTLRNQR